MNHIYFLIYTNSAQANFFLGLSPEILWFAALEFGGHNMVLATLAAFAGSTVGLCLNYALGFYISRWREKSPIYSDALYNKISRLFNDRLCVLLMIPPVYILEMIPGLTLFAIVCGLFRVTPAKAIAAIAVSRMLYYGYYLWTLGGS